MSTNDMRANDLRALSMPLVRLAVRSGLKQIVKGLTKEQENAIIDPIVSELIAVSAPMERVDTVPKSEHELLVSKYRELCKQIEAMRENAKLGSSDAKEVRNRGPRNVYPSDGKQRPR